MLFYQPFYIFLSSFLTEGQVIVKTTKVNRKVELISHVSFSLNNF